MLRRPLVKVMVLSAAKELREGLEEVKVCKAKAVSPVKIRVPVEGLVGAKALRKGAWCFWRIDGLGNGASS